MSRIEKRAFGRTGIDVTVLGFGGAPIGVLGTESRQVARILNLLLDEGVNLIDTAANYRGSEEAIAGAVGHRRDEFVLVSKCGQTFDDLPGRAWSAELIQATVDRSLKRLGTDHLDVMLLHTCDLETLKQGEAIAALVKSRDAGKIRFLGYSGDNDAAAYAADISEVSVIQTSINICDQNNIEAVLPKARGANLGVMAKRPIANAAWKDLSQQPGFYASYAKTYTERFSKMDLGLADLGLPDDSSRAWPEIALRFTLSQPGLHTAIVGTTNPDHVAANLAAAAKGPLPVEVTERLRTAFQEAESAAGERWLGLT